MFEAPSFLDYLGHGLTIDFHVAVDFTASNGDPRNSTSLHYGPETQYEKAIVGVAAVLDFYNASKYAFIIPFFSPILRSLALNPECFPNWFQSIQ